MPNVDAKQKAARSEKFWTAEKLWKEKLERAIRAIPLEEETLLTYGEASKIFKFPVSYFYGNGRNGNLRLPVVQIGRCRRLCAKRFSKFIELLNETQETKSVA